MADGCKRAVKVWHRQRTTTGKGLILELNKELTRQELQRIIERCGLKGISVAEKTLTAYYTGNPNDKQSQQQFEDSIQKAIKLLGRNGQSSGRGVSRLWAYGSGPGATASYGSIRGDLHPTRADVANPTAQRIASRLIDDSLDGIP
jgi:hypothetical protein